jgi:hemerythrin-like domain-containing protein
VNFLLRKGLFKMMRTTEILMSEHQVILSALEKLETILRDDLFTQEKELSYCFEFIKEYSDDYHHGKEEDVYFKWIVENNPGLEQGPISCMLKEHDIFRALVKKGKENLSIYLETKDQVAQKNCIEALSEFIENLRAHINKEDQVLYQMAEQINVNVKNGDEKMLGLFQEVEKAHPTIKEKFSELITQ